MQGLDAGGPVSPGVAPRRFLYVSHSPTLSRAVCRTSPAADPPARKAGGPARPEGRGPPAPHVPRGVGHPPP
ncbi:hypothetical protein GCM10009654_29490 [Streptomyces hebeiensis]|uniref:Uncharacterized protein n=1 Tax=Streptomyces hebeiensis TaxID=229486 RepID=A0ABN1UXL8_9ACTN